MEKTVESQSQQIPIPVAWQQHEDLAACMGEVYEKSLWTDVKFHCKNHEESVILRAHKIVLAGRSPVFKAMFFSPCADGEEEIEFDHADAKVLDLFLRFMYTDSTDLDEDTAPLVLKVAHYYQVNKLVQFCANYLATTLTTKNACTIFSLSMLYQVTSLRDSCCSFIDKNAEEILLSEGIHELPEECLMYIVKGDTFFAKEDAIFTTAEKWAKRKLQQEILEKNGPNIRKALGEAFYYLRLPTMTYKTFKGCVRRKGYFSVDEYEDITDFINGIPISSVQSNSCVPRIPTEEILTLNDEGGNTITTDKISSSFQISVTRDLKLSYITLAKVQQFMQYNEMLFKKTDSPSKRVSENNCINFFSNYSGVIMEIQTFTKSVKILDKAKGEPISDKVDVAITGHFNITCYNNEKKKHKTTKWKCLQKSDKKVHPSLHFYHDDDNEDDDGADYEDDDDDDDNEEHPSLSFYHDDDNEDDGVDYEDDDDDDEDDGIDDNIKLIIEQDFEVLSSKMSERNIDLKEHVILTNAESPYTFNLTLQYSCDSNVKMETKRSSSNDTITSVHGQLQVNDILGGFAGIRSLGFENISRRETV